MAARTAENTFEQPSITANWRKLSSTSSMDAPFLIEVF